MTTSLIQRNRNETVGECQQDNNRGDWANQTHVRLSELTTKQS